MTTEKRVNGQANEDFAEMIRHHVQDRPLPKRFYKDVAVREDEGGFAITLDGRVVKTPMRSSLSMESRAMAEAVAAEWDAQSPHIDPATMPLTRLVNTAIDRVAGDRQRIIDEILAYAGSDLLCYRADTPDILVARQIKAWDPVLDWAAEALGARLVAVSGLMHQPQPEESLAALGRHLAGMDAYVLTALHNMTTLSGSAVLAIAVAAGHLDQDNAWSVAHVDEDFQAEQWGEDEAAERRLQMRAAEFASACTFLRLSRQP